MPIMHSGERALAARACRAGGDGAPFCRARGANSEEPITQPVVEPIAQPMPELSLDNMIEEIGGVIKPEYQEDPQVMVEGCPAGVGTL